VFACATAIVVVAPFHADARYATFGLDNVPAMLLQFERYTALQATRPLSASAHSTS